MRKISEIIIHCADTPNGKEFHASDIDNWHKERGWKKIGYHCVICIDGRIEKGRGLNEVGAHCKGYNEESIGICLIGRDKFTNRQWWMLRGLTRELEYDLKIKIIKGHREYNSSKNCPGFDVQEWLKRDKEALEEHLLDVESI